VVRGGIEEVEEREKRVLKKVEETAGVEGKGSTEACPIYLNHRLSI
jgi:hypothetical protein